MERSNGTPTTSEDALAALEDLMARLEAFPAASTSSRRDASALSDDSVPHTSSPTASATSSRISMASLSTKSTASDGHNSDRSQQKPPNLRNGEWPPSGLLTPPQRSAQLSPPVSPLRMMARSPRSERSPRDELVYFASTDPLDAVPDPPSRRRSRSDALLVDADRTAQKLRIRPSKDVFDKGIGLRSPLAGSLTSQNLEDSRTSRHRPVPSAESDACSTSSDAGSRSASPTGELSVLGQRRPASIDSFGMNVTSQREREKRRMETSREWIQPLFVWVEGKEKKESNGRLGNPLMRESPRAKRKTQRDSTSSAGLVMPLDLLLNGDDARVGTVLPDFPLGAAPHVVGPGTKDGYWKKASGVLKGDGYFRIFDEDHVILHSIYLPSSNRTDVRLVDGSVFGRLQCVHIYRRGPATSSSQTTLSSAATRDVYSAPPSASTSSLGSSSASTFHRVDGVVYLAMPTIVAAQSWLVLARCFARPDNFHRSMPTTGLRSASSSDDEGEAAEGKFRVWRSLVLTIVEGRGIGEWSDTTLSPKGSSEMASTTSFSESSASLPHKTFSLPSPAKILARGGGMGEASSRERDVEGGTASLKLYIEVVFEGEVVARSSVRKGTSSPFWRETFTLEDLPPLLRPVCARVYQNHKSARPTLLGSASVRVGDLVRGEKIEDWWPVKPLGFEYRGIEKRTIGDLSLALKIREVIVLSSTKYATLLEILKLDDDASVVTELIATYPHCVEPLSDILLDIYIAESRLLPRLCRLLEAEVGAQPTAAALLFRGNTICTKLIEGYMRLIGSDFLTVSLGDVVRRICVEQVEIEIDPAKFKGGVVKEKELQANMKLLKEWVTRLWNSIYDARQSCPNEFRLIFGRLQTFVGAKYAEPKTRSTCVSGFLYLRYFVPAILNPQQFGIVSSPADPRAQRTLTLVAKTIQGLGNFSQFGTKEPWMAGMASFVTESSESFVDYIDHVSTPSSSPRFEWTSPSASVYLAPNRLRTTLPPSVREGIPVLPHLIDTSKNLALLASLVNKLSSAQVQSSAVSTRTAKLNTATTFSRFVEVCVDLDEQAMARAREMESANGVSSPTSSRAVPSSGLDSRDMSPPRQTLNHTPSISSLSSSCYSSEPAPSPPTGRRQSNRNFTLGGSAGSTLSQFSPPTSPLPFESESLRQQQDGFLVDRRRAVVSPLGLTHELTSYASRTPPPSPSARMFQSSRPASLLASRNLNSASTSSVENDLSSSAPSLVDTLEIAPETTTSEHGKTKEGGKLGGLIRRLRM